MALTVNPDAGGSAPDTFRDEGLYAFRFDLNGDAREEVAFKVLFGEVSHAEGDGHRHVQTFEVRKATGASALSGAEGELLASGQTGLPVTTLTGVRAFAGLAPELFVGNAAGVGAFRKAFYEEGRFAPEVFENAKDFFHGKNVTAIVLEIPIDLIGGGDVRAWATVSLYGHAPERQVSRWGLPLITHIFLPDVDSKEAYNRAVPGDDMERFSPQIGHVVEKATTLAKSVPNPGDYARSFVERFCPSTLPYTLGSDAAFTTEKFNGRALTDDVVDVILSLMTNTQLGDGVSSDASRVIMEFPYFGKPYGS